MILPIIVIVWLMFSAGATIQVTLTEITSPTDRFNRYVWSITLHTDNPRLLIVTDVDAVHTFNPETKAKKLIAGSTTSGYVEGRGAVARFDDIFGVSYFNETTIIVTDEDNHCVRLVNLVSQLTERYAGVCQSYGYSDGERLSTKFNYPRGITRVGTSYYICDLKNQKIRQLTGNSVSTVVLGINYPTAITSTQNKLFYSFIHGIGEFDLNSQTNKILTGGASYGSGDGSLSSAGFGWMYGITSLTEKILLAADINNQAVRLVDLNKHTVSSITMPTPPFSLLPYNGNILVGLAGGRIVKFSLTQLPVTQTADIKCDTNKTLSTPTTDYTVRFEPRIIRSNEVECVRCPSSQDLSVGVHTFSYTYMNKLGKYVQKICEHQITVIAECSNKSAEIDILRGFVGLLAVVVIVAVIYIIRLKSNHSTQTKSAAELGQPTPVTQEQTDRVYDSLKMDNYDNVKTYEQIQTQQNPSYEEILRTESKKEL